MASKQLTQDEKREYFDRWIAKRRDETIARLREISLRLNKLTEDCRLDMHEPDEQELVATVIGDHLDNAFGESVTEEDGFQEFVVQLSKDGDQTERFNLADLIALARLAVPR